jgi:hypothetical protein
MNVERLAQELASHLAVRVNERRWFSLLNRERSSTGPVAMVSCFGRVDG